MPEPSEPSRRRRGSTLLRRTWRTVAAPRVWRPALSITIVLAGLPFVLTASSTFTPPDPEEVTSVPGGDLVAAPGTPPVLDGARLTDPGDAAWPDGGSADVALSAGAMARAGNLPVSVRPAENTSGTAHVEVLSQEAAEPAGLTGVLIRVDAPGPVEVGVDYASFGGMVGGDWARRLRLMRLPECALTTPTAPECAGVPLAGMDNSADASALMAPVDASGGVLLAVAAEEGGDSGTFEASSLKPSDSWTAGTSTGDFTWAYDVTVPEGPGGPSPSVKLGYSSSRVDGSTATTNNQPSWVGAGFDYSSGYIERSYKSCTDDMSGGNNSEKSNDLCWPEDDVVNISLGGTASQLIWTGSTWRPRVEDGSRIELLKKPEWDNGDNDGEYWKVTLTNGTQYFFGRNHLPGWSDGKAVTNATWSVPVYGNHSGEDCHEASFAGSWCQQAWRWNLDYVVDARGNTMSLWYDRETDRYGRNNDADAVSTYHRGGNVKRIDYGTRSTTAFGTAPEQIVFTTADRCMADKPCDIADEDNWKNWPDTPWDLHCKAAPCEGKYGPAFFTSKRLATITTKVNGVAGAQMVSTYTLRHSYIKPGDGTRAGLWLDGITKKGHLYGATKSLPEVTFDGVLMHNRVDGIDNAPPMNWPRMRQITMETGGSIVVDYSARDCVAGATPDPDTNTRRCYPVYWTRPGQLEPELDWFHKYVTTAVYTTDPFGNATSQVTTSYEYKGGGAWHKAEDFGLVPKKRLTYSEWRGYAEVRTTLGQGDEKQVTDTLYMRGMDGDPLPGGGSRDVDVEDSRGVKIPDANWHAGATREEITYDSDMSEVTGTISDPWASAATGTATIGGTTIQSRFVNTSGTHVRTALDGGRGYRNTATVTEFNGRGQPIKAHDKGDLAVATDDKCTTTSYVDNTDKGIRDLVARETVTALPCGTAPTTWEQVISDGRKLYDGLPFGSPPVKGDVSSEEKAVSWTPGGGSVFKTFVRSEYDVHGRVVKTWDVLGRLTTTAFTPTTGGPTTKTVVTDPMGFATTSELDGVSGLPLTAKDANGNTTFYAYDPLGRLVKGWKPGRSTTQTPDLEFAYLLAPGTAPAVEQKELLWNGGQGVSYTIYDGLGRERQTQSPSPMGGRVLSDTFYDSAGRVSLVYGGYYNEDSGPSPKLFTTTDRTLVAEQNRTVFDGTGRPIADVFQPFGTERWRTSTVYGGDRTDVIPPQGATVTSTFNDARGRDVEVRYYAGRTTTGDYDTLTYTHDAEDRIRLVRDAAGNKWTYEYDFRDRLTSLVHPDRGLLSFTYDEADRVIATEDARGAVLNTTYDALDRKKTISSDGVLRAEWLYDTVAKGQLTSSTRFEGQEKYVSSVSSYDAAYRPLTSSVTIPASETGVAGTYTTYNSYFPDGKTATTTLPEVGDLPEEFLQYVYDDYGLPKQLGTDFPEHEAYVLDTQYDALAQVTQYTLGTTVDTDKLTYRGFSYEPGTKRLATSMTSRSGTSANTLSEVHYRYDAAGNILSMADTPTGNPAAKQDVQCYRYDQYRRLTEAWTAEADDCGADPTAENVGGVDPYWQSWEFDEVGNRLSETDRLGKLTTTYTRNAAGEEQPHAPLTASVMSETTGRTAGATYGYDETGNMRSRTAAGGETQALTWDVEGHLDTIDSSAVSSSYVYDPEGERLLREDADGTRKLFLGSTELSRDGKTGELTATRSYSWNDETVAVRSTGSNVSWMVADHHGTGSLSVDAETLEPTHRRTNPYGEARSSTPVEWPDSKGFLGGEEDPSGLTHIGAREYDPNLGSFVSVDPIVDVKDPQQLHGYAYANNTPVTASDESGLLYDIPHGGGSSKPSKPKPNVPRPGVFPNAEGFDWRYFETTIIIDEGPTIRVIWYSERLWCKTDTNLCAGTWQPDGTFKFYKETVGYSDTRFIKPGYEDVYESIQSFATSDLDPLCYRDPPPQKIQPTIRAAIVDVDHENCGGLLIFGCDNFDQYFTDTWSGVSDTVMVAGAMCAAVTVGVCGVPMWALSTGVAAVDAGYGAYKKINNGGDKFWSIMEAVDKTVVQGGLGLIPGPKPGPGIAGRMNGALGMNQSALLGTLGLPGGVFNGRTVLGTVTDPFREDDFYG